MGLDGYLTLNVIYNMKNGEFNVSGNVKKEKQSDLILEFLGKQVGKWQDDRVVNIKDSYNISIKWYPHLDRFEVSRDNTDNKELRYGILADVAEKLLDE